MPHKKEAHSSLTLGRNSSSVLYYEEDFERFHNGTLIDMDDFTVRKAQKSYYVEERK